MSAVYQEQELESHLRKCPEWEADASGQQIAREIEFEEYMEGIDFVNNVAELAEDNFHHPDLFVKYGSVTVTLTTHDEGGVTARDIEMAQKIDNLVD